MAGRTIRSGRRDILHCGHKASKSGAQATRDGILGQVGEIWLCGIRVGIQTTGDWGGNFDFPGAQDPRGHINLGLRPAAWWVVQDTILHELLEFAFTWRKHRYHADGEMVGDSSEGALFVFDHSQMAECIRQVSNAWSLVEGMVKPRWKKYKKVERIVNDNE